MPVLDVYARLSVAPDGDTINVDDQVGWCSDAVQERGALVGEVFKDNSLSAWKLGVVRPEWEALMARLESGASDGVMVLDLTRFSRKVMEGERLVEMANRGLLVWSLSGSYELSTADGRRHFRESMVAAAAESDKISERVRRGKLRRARKGKLAGSGQRGYAMPGYLPAPVGWEAGEPRERVPAEQLAAERAVVEECYRRLFAGDTLAEVVRDLNASQVLTAAGGPWRTPALGHMLCRPALAGLVAHKGEIVTTLAGIEPVVSREEWERMCGLFSARKRGRPAGRVHLLSGLVRCGRCGRPMFGVPRRNQTPYADGSPRREYRCRRSVDYPGCGRNHMDALAAESAVAEAVKARLGDPRRAERVAARLALVRAERATVEAEIQRLEESADALAEKTAAWGFERVDKAMAPILRRVQALREELAGMAEPESPSVAAADAADAWDRAMETGDTDTLRLMVRRAFPRLTLHPPQHYGDSSLSRLDWDGVRFTDAMVAAT